MGGRTQQYRPAIRTDFYFASRRGRYSARAPPWQRRSSVKSEKRWPGCRRTTLGKLRQTAATPSRAACTLFISHLWELSGTKQLFDGLILSRARALAIVARSGSETLFGYDWCTWSLSHRNPSCIKLLHTTQLIRQRTRRLWPVAL